MSDEPDDVLELTFDMMISQPNTPVTLGAPTLEPLFMGDLGWAFSNGEPFRPGEITIYTAKSREGFSSVEGLFYDWKRDPESFFNQRIPPTQVEDKE